MRTYSNSKLTTYEDCPQRYKLMYIVRAKPREEEERIEAFLGLRVHKALEYLEKEKSMQT